MHHSLVDTSVWIDWFNQKDTIQTERLALYISDDNILSITPTILQKVLQGIGDAQKYEAIKASLLTLFMLTIDPVEAAIGAAALYRTGRKKGITIRKPNDCLIAYYAIFYKVPLLHNDNDFDQIALYSDLIILRL